MRYDLCSHGQVRSRLQPRIGQNVLRLAERARERSFSRAGEKLLVLVVPTGHPLTELKPVTLSDAAKHGFLVPKNGRRRELIDHLFVQNRTARHILMELDSSELIKRLIVAGLGISFLLRINAIDEVNQGLVQIIDVKGVSIPRNLALISRNDMPLTRAGNAFFTSATGTVRKPARSPKPDSSAV